VDIQKLFDLYIKEREYERKVFGDYANDPNLNVASFLQFIEETLQKAKTSYVNKWGSELPPWLLSCKEYYNGSPAPHTTYEYLVKVFALAGAALESYTNIDVEKWREDLTIKDKWRE
jgi:hypothetical protein